MIKKFISNTFMFIAIVSFINIFKQFFGDKNILVGVSIVVSALVLMGLDLTKKPVENFFKLLIINLSLGIIAKFASNNLWLGVILNFLVLSTIGYTLSYNLTKSVILPFGLQYLFMLYTPVYGYDFSLRIAALIFAPIAIMIYQYIAHGGKRNIEVQDSDILEYKNESKEEDLYYKVYNIFGKDVEVHTIRASYAIRVGILTAITGFIESLLFKYYNIQEGRWMVYTIFSLTELYSEHCRIRSKQRLEGTIIGALIVIILFMFIKNSSLRALIVLLAGFINPFLTNYRDIIICVTVSVVASLGLTNGSILAAALRIIFVIIGIAFALLGNKYIFNKSIKE